MTRTLSSIALPKRMRKATFLDDWLTTPALRERVLARIGNCRPTEQGCLLWLGGIVPKGYGRVSIRWKGDAAYDYVHRLAWERANNRRLQPGEVVRHSCDTPACRAEGHLFVGTHQDNSNDQVARGRTQRGRDRPMAVLTECAVRDIRSHQHSFAFYARKYGVAVGTIQDVMEMKSWRHVR